MECDRKASNCDFDFAFAVDFALRRWVAHPSHLSVRILVCGAHFVTFETWLVRRRLRVAQPPWLWVLEAEAGV
jgi:hypothetical protein